MNEIIQHLNNHRSIRKFTDQPVEEEQLHAILTAAQMASSSSNVQAYSIIRVNDAHLRKELADLAGQQKYVYECAEFHVWCADLHRLKVAYELHEEPTNAHFDTTENLLIATIDTALAAQNAAIAAESLGLGIVYIGGIRNHIREVTQLLKLPKLVYPVFGMCIGHPNQNPMKKPRLPLEAILHSDRYEEKPYADLLRTHNKTMQQYMRERTGKEIDYTWTEEMMKKFNTPLRSHMKDYLYEQHFGRK